MGIILLSIIWIRGTKGDCANGNIANASPLELMMLQRMYKQKSPILAASKTRREFGLNELEPIEFLCSKIYLQYKCDSLSI
jgi:hypothetical protein